MTRRYVFWFLALGFLGFLGSLQGWLVEAGTITGGTAVTLGGLDSFANTVQTYLKGNVGKMLAMILAVAGIAMVVMGKMGLGISGLGSGILVAFVPNIIGDAFDATAADPVAGVSAVRAVGSRQRGAGLCGPNGPCPALAASAGAEVRA